MLTKFYIVFLTQYEQEMKNVYNLMYMVLISLYMDPVFLAVFVKNNCVPMLDIIILQR